MKILITGYTGLVGSNLEKRLRENTAHKLLCLSRSNGYDLMDKDLVREAVTDFKPDVVYHLAANAAESRGQVSPIEMTESNLMIFLHTLIPSINAGVKRFIYTSSVAVYGEAELPYEEDSIPKPKDIYGINKLACENMLKLLAKLYNFDYTIFRPHNIYGPHQDMSNPYKNVVALFMRYIMEDKPLTLFGGGKMKRAFSYVDDVVDVLEQATSDTFKNQTVNLGSSMEVEIIELLKVIEKVAGKKAEVTYKDARPQEIWNFLANHKRLGILYPYHETPLEIGIKKTWEFLNLPEIKKQYDELH